MFISLIAVQLKQFFRSFSLCELTKVFLGNLTSREGGGDVCANNKGADQPAHLCRLISTFVIRFLESIIHVSKLATSELSIF